MKGRPNGSNLELFFDFKYRPKESPMKTYYVGMDVHRATIALAVLNGAATLNYRTGSGSDLAVWVPLK